jgi:L-ribulose-5-phosphate 3-epimerase
VSGIDITRRNALVMAGGAAAAALLPGGRSVAAEGASAPTKPVRPALTLFSRHLHWTSMEDAVEVAANGGFGAIAWTVRAGAHVEPQNVARDLPRAVELTHRAGLGTPLFVTSITGADSPYAQPILETATGLGIRLYRTGDYAYEPAGNYPAQLEALRPRIAGLVRLNERYGATGLIHTHSGGTKVAGAVWDIWLLLRDFDPNRMAINFDTGHGMLAAGVGWVQAVRFARSHIRSLSLKDCCWRPQQTGRPPWTAEICVPGQGMVNFQEMLGYFQSTGFHGPAEVQFEYPIEVPGRAAPIDLMTTQGVGQWKLDMPKADFIALLKRDVDFYAGWLRETGLIPASGIASSA